MEWMWAYQEKEKKRKDYAGSESTTYMN